MQVFDADKLLQVMDVKFFFASKVIQVPALIVIKQKEMKAHMQPN